MIRYSTLSAVLIVSALVSGCTDELDRPKAASFLSKLNFGGEHRKIGASPFTLSGGFPDPAEGKAQMESFIFGSDSEAEAIWSAADSSYVRKNLGHARQIRSLVKLGIINSITWKEKPTHHDNPNSKYYSWRYLTLIPHLSDEVKTFCVEKQSSGSCNAIVSKKRFGNVTGITGEGNHRNVQFTVLTEPNKLGSKLEVNPQTETRNATFILYDDGWRIAR